MIETATNVQSLGTFTPFTPDPWPEGAPPNAIFVKNANNVELSVALDWYGSGPTGDYFFAVDANNVVRISCLDTGLMPDNELPKRVSFFPWSPMETLHVYRISGLTDRGVDAAYNLWKWDGQNEFKAPGFRVVTRTQAKIQLSREGLLTQVKAAVQAAGGEVEIWFDDAATWERDNPYVQQIGTALGLNSAQIDELFVQASLIVA